jgi:hypothetical protein
MIMKMKKITMKSGKEKYPMNNYIRFNIMLLKQKTIKNNNRLI